MKNIWKIIPVLVPVFAVGTVALGAAVSLSGYEAPVYGKEEFRVVSENTEVTEPVKETEEEEETSGEVQAAGSFDLADGTYVGSARGFSGTIKVSVEIKDKSITAIDILSHSDDAAFFNRAKAVIDRILSLQSLDVDTVSGATYSSRGIINAVKNALTGESDKTAQVIAQGDFDLADGFYEGTGTGFGGPVKVSVEVKNRTIVAINVLSHSDDAAFFDRAKEGVVGSILSTQKLDVDTVSGATFSSKGIISAVKNAITGETEGQTVIGQGDFDLADGIYEGSAQGFSGKVRVAVEIKNRTIVSIEILSCKDDESFFNRAKGVIDDILANQDMDDVDTVSGATYSSRGIINAVKNALGLDDDEDEKEQVKGDFDLADGTYTGTGQGFKGKVKVSVTIKDKTITEIKILSHKDDKTFFRRAEEGVIDSILSAQKLDVDTVSGATYSSKGIISAVKNALTKDDGKKTEPEVPTDAFPYPDGIYTGIGEGYGGDIAVTIVIQDKTMKAILVTSHENEDDTFFNRAKAVADHIVKNQSVAVDTISGATYSSRGIIEGVNNALEEAKKAASGETAKPSEPDDKPNTGDHPGADISAESVYYGVVTCSPDEYEDFEAYHLHVKVVFQNGKIKEISDVYGDGDSGNDRYIRKAVEGSTKYPGVAAQIVSKNGAEGIDTVSGATCSSRAVIDAVDILLKAASKDGNYTAGAGNGSEEQPGGDNTGEEGDGSEGGDNTGDEGGSSEGGDNTGEEGDTFLYENGEYVVSAACEPDEWWDFDPYNLTLTLVLENDRIIDIKNISGDGDSENDYYIKRAANGTKANPGIVSQIMEKNSSDGIDTISGATCSSRAIIEACTQALKAAEKQQGQE